MTKQLKHLHKKFIPGNIVFCLIAIIAMLAQLFMPFFDLRIKVYGESLAAALEREMDSSASTQQTYIRMANTDEKEESVEDKIARAILDAIKGVDFEVPVNFYPIKMLKAATGTEQDVVTFMNSVVGQQGTEGLLEEVVTTFEKPVLTIMFNTVADEMIDRIELDEEQREQVEKYRDEIDVVVDLLIEGSPQHVEQAKVKMLDTIKAIAENEGGEPLTDEEIADFQEMIDEAAVQGTKPDGSFDIIYLLQNFDIEGYTKEDVLPEEVLPQAAAMTSTASLSQATATAENDEKPSGMGAKVAEIIDILRNPGQTLVDVMKEEGLSVRMMQLVFLGVFVVMAGLQAFFWGLFAVCCFARIFMEQKAVRTRYVRILCVWCGLGVVVGNLLVGLLPTILAFMGISAQTGALGVVFNSVSVKFLGAGVVTGICWLVMVIFNLAYYRPIRKAVKKERKRLKMLMDRGFLLDENGEVYMDEPCEVSL